MVGKAIGKECTDVVMIPTLFKLIRLYWHEEIMRLMRK